MEQRLRYGDHRGSITDARHAGAQVLDLYDVYPAERRTLAQMDVGGWKAEILAELRAVHHMAAERVGTAEEPLGMRKVADRERRAHGRAWHPFVGESTVGHRLGRKPFSPHSS